MRPFNSVGPIVVGTLHAKKKKLIYVSENRRSNKGITALSDFIRIYFIIWVPSPAETLLLNLTKQMYANTARLPRARPALLTYRARNPRNNRACPTARREL